MVTLLHPLILFFVLSSLPLLTMSSPDLKSFTNCLSEHLPPSTNLSLLLHTPSSPSFHSLLQSSIRNLLFTAPTTRQPILIIIPTSDSHVQASVICCRAHGFRIRTRSGGHDYEGLSYRSEDENPFVIVDLAELRKVVVDVKHETVEVQAGATLGELSYWIAKASSSLGFPAGICPTVGVGGHISGGGFGTMLRKYGLASDNVLDARLVDVDGRILNRASMGEDLFWAIRGGGGASFGIILSYTLKLVRVPNPVTVFTLHKTLAQGAIHLIHRWQSIAHKLPDDLFIRIVIQPSQDGTEVEALFNSLFLGSRTDLLHIMAGSFPELGLKFDDCIEMSWAESVMYFAFYTGRPMEALLDRGSKPERFFKAKSDYVTEPFSASVFEEIWPRFLDDGAGVLIMEPYGGKVSSIGEFETPFPHRRVLYNIQYFVEWTKVLESEKRIAWVRGMYRDLGAYISKESRGAYLNYRDLDLGSNEEDENGSLRYDKAKVWGFMYFKGNLERLTMVKGRVDSGDFFRNEQSIPPLVVNMNLERTECEESEGKIADI